MLADSENTSITYIRRSRNQIRHSEFLICQPTRLANIRRHRSADHSGPTISFLVTSAQADMEVLMGRGILLWFLGIPIPIIILIMLFVR
jgi:hypothetical protein